MFRLKIVIDGAAAASGWNDVSVPRATFNHGRIRSAAKIKSSSAPPAVCTHFPTLRPRTVIATSPPMSSALTIDTTSRLLSAAAADGAT